MYNDISPEPKRPCRKKTWLLYEDKIVMDKSLSIKEKALLLNRTPSSIKTRLWRLKQK